MIIQKLKDGMVLSVKVIPKSSSNEIAGIVGDFVKVKLTCAPEKGKANKSLIQLFAKVLKLSRSDLSIIKGRTSSRKLILIKGLEEEHILRLLGEQYDKEI